MYYVFRHNHHISVQGSFPHSVIVPQIIICILLGTLKMDIYMLERCLAHQNEENEKS